MRWGHSRPMRLTENGIFIMDTDLIAKGWFDLDEGKGKDADRWING